MNRNKMLSVISIVAIITMLASPVASLAQGAANTPDRNTAEYARPAGVSTAAAAPLAGLSQAEPEPLVSIGDSLPSDELPQGELAGLTGQVDVVIELQDDPTTVLFARERASEAVPGAATRAAQAQLAKIEQAQQALLAPLSKLEARVIYRTQRVYNGIAVSVDAKHLAEIQAMPGVKAVHRLIPKSPDNWSSVPLIGAPQMWDAAGAYGMAGEGIKVGVIDSGIDYIHTDFGGLGTTAVYSANLTTVVTDTYGGNPIFPTVKVVGGWDFVGDDYDANPANPTYQPIPHPDPDPAPCYTGGTSADHGTHVAGTIAGYGVNADGTTYTGAYTATMNWAGFKIGPGVAPKAELYSLRVFGCNGSTNVTDQAIEWAVDPNGDGDFSDHLDVINMSLGSTYGSTYDASAVASDNAALAGVVVVASSGNSADVYYITGSPAVAGRALSVAGVDDGGIVFDGFRIETPTLFSGVYAASQSVYFDWTTFTSITHKLVYPEAGPNPAQDQRTGCYAFNVTNTAAISGNIVLIDWNLPSCGGSGARVTNAYNAGAKGVIMSYNAWPFDISIGGAATIPAVISPQDVGNLLKTALATNIVTVTLNSAYQASIPYYDPVAANTVYNSSSRGPRRGDSFLKPDLAAPAVTVFSAWNHSGYKGTSKGGTSMAAPHVAGTMALLRQLHPAWSVEELKALAMNTALTDVHVYGGTTRYGPGRIGAGRVSVPDAAASPAVAYNAGAPYLVSVSFGAPEVIGTSTATRRIRVVNKEANPLTYTVAYSNFVDMPGVTYTLSLSRVVLAPYGVANVVVTMTANAAQMKHTLDPTVATAGPRHWLSEEAGYAVFYPDASLAGVPRMRVPIYATPRAASAMGTVQTGLTFSAPTASTALTLTGQGLNTGTSYPVDTVSLVTAFELQESSPDDAASVGLTNNADLKYIGVTNNYRNTNNVANTMLYFAIATYGNHSTPAPGDAEFDIYIDTNLDGTYDYVAWNSTAATNDVFRTKVYNLSTGATTTDQYPNIYTAAMSDTAIYNSNVLVLPIRASLLGLAANKARFNYRVFSFSRDADGNQVDSSAVHSYSAATAGLDFTGGAAAPIWRDLPGNTIPVQFNLPAYTANASQGALLFHLHNAGGAREQVLPVTLPNMAQVTLLHTNDFHGNLELSGSNPGMARTAYMINTQRGLLGSSNTMLLDAGDIMQGSLLSNLFYGKSTINVYNCVGYQGATVGNHEFDWGQTVLSTRISEANFPFVAANLVVSDTGSCSTAGWTPPSFVKPWITKTVGAPGNQVVVGIIGVTSQETPYITIASATQGLCFKDPKASVLQYYDAVKAAGADVIVVLSHIGYNDGGYGYGIPVYGDQTLARELVKAGKPAHLIIGGHSHTDLAAATNISGTIVAQAHYNGRKVGRADITLDKTTGAVTVAWQRLTVTTGAPEDATVKACINTWATDPWYQAEKNRFIGYSNVDLLLNYNGDSLMGKFVNDSIYGDLNTDGEPLNDADMVFNNPGGLRVNITSTTKPYTLTHGMLFSVLPFGNQTIVGDMTGAQIQDLLNQSATLFKGALQVSGIRYTFYNYTDTLPGPQPWAWGAYSITVKNRTTGVWEPLVMTKTYRVATNEFLAPAGQDGFTPFKYMTNISYWGDMLNGVERWVSKMYSTTASAYNEALDGRITRDGTAAGGSIIPVTILHHNDSHGRLAKSGSTPGYTQLATLIKQERNHNPTRNLLLNAGDQIQGDPMMYYYKTAFTGFAVDGTALPPTMTIHPMIAAMNAMTYAAMTIGNHEYNFGSYVFTGTFKQAAFPVLQANVYDDGRYGMAGVPVRSHVTVTLPGPSGNIKVAVLGIGNHRIPNYELASNIPGLSFTNPITETQARAPQLQSENDAVVALTHIGFTIAPGSVEVDENVDTVLAAQTTGVDAIIGGHSHTIPDGSKADAFRLPYKYLPAIVGNPDNVPVLINQAYRYNTYLGEVILGLRAKTGGGYEVLARAGRYLDVTSSTAEDTAIKNIVTPYVNLLATYNNKAVGRTTRPIDALTAFTEETNAANLQADASVWELAQHGINVDFHLSGAMTNQKIADGATTATPVTLTVANMFTLMPYENSLLALRMNGPQLKRVLERAYRNYYYYKYVPGWGGYSHYTTCMLDINAGNQITYRDTYPALPNGDNVASLVVNGQPIDFLNATKYYTVSTVNYLAAGSCNFKDSGVSLWPLDQLVADTQYYVRDAVINYVTNEGLITPTIEGRLQFISAPNLATSRKSVVDDSGDGLVQPDEVLHYTITITNDGAISATVRLTDTLPASLTYVPDSLSYSPSLVAAFNGNVLTGNTTTNLVPGAHITVAFAAQVNTVLTAGALVSNSVTLADQATKYTIGPASLPMATVYGVELAPAAATQAGDLGATVTYTLRLTNTGNAADTFTVTLSGNSWTVNPVANVGPLAAGAGTDVLIVVHVPLDPGGVMSDTVTVTATSQGDPSKTDASALTTTVGTVYGLLLEPPTAAQSGAPGAVVAYTLRLTNTGTTTDTFDLTSAGVWAVNLPVTNTTLAAGAGVDVIVNVTVPAGALPGDSDTTVITAASRADISKTDAATLTTTALTAYGVTIEPPTAAKSGVPGEIVAYTLRVTNTGNTADTFDLTSAGVWAVALPVTNTGVLAPGAGVDVIVNVIVPTGALPGDSDTTIITATSRADATKSDASTLTTTVGNVYDLDLAPTADAASGYAGQGVTYTLRLTNTGNVTDTFTFTYTGNLWVVSMPITSFELAAGAGVDVVVRVEIPPTAAPLATDVVTITATSTGDATKTASAVLTTTAKPYGAFLPVMFK